MFSPTGGAFIFVLTQKPRLTDWEQAGQGSKKVKKILSFLPTPARAIFSSREDANGVILFSVNRYIKNMISGMMKKMVPEGVEAPQAEMMDKLGNLDLPILVCYTVEDGNMEFKTSISMDKILAVKALIEEMMAPPAPEEPVPASHE